MISIMYVCLIDASAQRIRGEYATKNLVGQNYYLKRCSSCHGEGSRGGNMASIREWAKLFSKNALELKELHLDDDSTSKILAYFDSNDFNKEAPLMMKLLQEFAYDSEHIPTCN
jgi:cytochrome c